MMEYNDIVNYFEDNLELAYRDGHIELNKSSLKVSAIRRFINGRWIIASCQGCDVNELRPDELITVGDSPTYNELLDTELYVGRISLGALDRDPKDLIKAAADVCNELKGANVIRCEFIINIRNYRKVIERDVGVASEEKVVIELLAGVISRGLRYGYGGVHTALVTNLSNVGEGVIDKLLRRAYEKSIASSKAKALNPVFIGRHQLLLRPEVTAALIHELSHLLEATAVNRIPIGRRIGPHEVEVIDDPYNSSSPTIRVFDDEGVPTIKRKLIEDGVVIDYHHTRLTAKQLDSRAGSSYGLYHPPIPYHTTLVMGAGDWRDDELLRETRSGFVVEGVIKAETEGNYIRIVPEYTLYIDGGEVRDRFIVNEVKIPLSKLMTISAIGRIRDLRVSYEKGYLVSELAPAVRIEGYIG